MKNCLNLSNKLFFLRLKIPFLFVGHLKNKKEDPIKDPLIYQLIV